MKQRVEETLANALEQQLGVRPQLEFRHNEHRRWRWDLAFSEQRLLIDIQGFRYHSRAQDIRNDCEKMNSAVEMSYKVLKFPANSVQSPTKLESIVRQVERVLFQVGDAYQSSHVLTPEK